MKKSLAILLSICLVLTTIYGCFVITASATAETEVENLWLVDGAPNQSTMSYWNDPAGSFAGEAGGNSNYILGQDHGKVSPYGWRGVGLRADVNQRVGRYDGNYVHGDSPAALECGLMVQLKYAQRGVSRQIQLEAGKAYTLSFWFKGTITGFDVQALSSITNNHETGGTSCIKYQNYNINTKSQSFSDVTGSTWVYVTVKFSLPNDKSVANIILANGNVNDTDAAFDDFFLYHNLWDVAGAPDQSGMSYWNDSAGQFAGETSGNANYIMGQSNGKVSPYGWRGYGLAAAGKQRAGRLSDSGGTYYHHNPVTYHGLDCAFVVDLQSDTTRGVSRQIQLTAGKSYTLTFYFKGVVQGFDITALSSIQNTHQSAAGDDSIITSMDYDLATTGQSFSTVSADVWAYVTVTFTMPSDKSVANVILGEGKACHAAYDDFLLYESAPVLPNLWAVKGAPDQCTMSYWGDGNFAGEAGGNANYILGQSNSKVSPYGWRGYGLAAAGQQRAGRLSDSNGVYYHHNPTQALDCAFVVDLQSDTTRGVSRQIQLEAGKSYMLNFYFKGVVQGFDITALSAIQNTHQSAVGGDSIITSMDYNLATTGQSFSVVSADVWAYVTVTFTMPSDKSVANFILGEGKACHAAYDDFELYEAPAVVAISTSVDFTGMNRPNPSYTGGNTASAASASATEGDTVALTATPASGFTFDGWYLGGSKVSSNASYTATIGTDGNYVAKFAPTSTTNYWEGGDMESISPKYSYLGSNITNGENEDGWITVRTGNYSPVRAVPDNTVSYNSSTSLKLDFSGAVRGVGKRLKLTNGNAYTISFYYKGGGNGFGVYNHNSISTTLVCNDVDNGLRAMSTANDGPAAELVYDTPRGNDWRQYTYTFTLSAGDYVDIVWTAANAAYLDDVTIVSHTHTWGALVPETTLSCDSDGHYAYYYCEACGSYKNTSGNVVPWSEISKGERPAHDLTHHAAVAATCTAAGSIEYWSCATCGKNYAEEACENVIDGSVVIAALGHSYTVYAYQAPTCTVDGHTAYKVCSRCSQVVDGSDNPITIESTVLPHFHGNAELLTYHAAVAPTVDIDGNVAYYTCPGCSDYSLDVNFTEAGGSSFFNEYIKLTVAAPVEYGNLSFDGDIGLSIALDIDGYHLTSPKLVVRSYNGDNSEKVTEYTEAQLGAGAGSLANFNMLATGLDASQIANDIVIELYDGDSQVDEFHDGESTWVTSIKDVLEQYINIYKTNDDAVSRSLVTFCKTTLTYGAAAQDYFGTIASVRADENYSVDISGITAGDISASRTYSNNHIGIRVKSASFFATSQSAVRFYVDFEDDSTIEDYTFEATMGGQSLATFGARTSSGLRATDGTPYFEVKDIPARHLNKMINITIKRSGSVALTASYNALVYVKGWLSYTPSEVNPEPENYEALLVLCKGIYAMSEAAEDYFEMVD